MDKSALRLLTPEQRKQLDSKHRILYPPILVIENAQHGLDKPSALFDFENTVSVLYWVQRAKLDLLKGEASRHYRVGAKIPTLSIYEEPEADRKEMEKQATRIVEVMEAEEKQLKKQTSLLHGTDPKLMQLIMNHRDIPDKNILREFNRVVNHADLNYPPSLFASLIGRGSGNILKVRNILDSEQGMQKSLELNWYQDIRADISRKESVRYLRFRWESTEG